MWAVERYALALDELRACLLLITPSEKREVEIKQIERLQQTLDVSRRLVLP
jgi:hypothetical protein